MRKHVLLLFISLFFLSSCQDIFLNDVQSLPTQPVELEESSTNENVDVVNLIGKNVDEAIQHFGNPNEKGLSSFNYEWLVYNKDSDKYMQIGYSNNKIVTIFILGHRVISGPIAIGNTYNDIATEVTIQDSVTIHYNKGEYRFDLNNQDIKERPLVQLSEHTYAQLYFDRFLNQLVAIRLLDKETLIKQRPYRIVYRGSLEETTKPNKQTQKEIEQTNVKQIFDITNVLRERYGQQSLRWNEPVASVAFSHSKDMKVNRYFDHDSPTNGNLENRLKNHNVKYFLAGENIAAEYPDGIAAVMGWLNSEGHRETMFHEKFTDLGVGVYDKHYTQNFITK